MILSIGFDVRLSRLRLIRRTQATRNASLVARKLFPSVRLRRPHSERERLDPETPIADSLIEAREAEWTELLSSLTNTHGSITEEETVVLRAFKLSMLTAERAPIEFPVMGRLLLQKSISVASSLMNLFHQSNPNADHEIIAASLLVEQVWKEHLPLESIKAELNSNIFKLTNDVIQIRRLIEDIDMIDDISAGNCQKKIFRQFDKRAILLEFIAKLDCLRHVHLVPYDVQVPLALDCLYVHVAIGRLLQLPALSNEMEERCMRILFPTSYAENKNKFNLSLFQSQGAFRFIREKLQEQIQKSEALKDLIQHVEVKTRVKTTSSFMRKLLSLSDLSKGGRKPEEVFDALGVRVIVYPNCGFLSEENGAKACYLIRDIACELWPNVEDRSKDYILKPKANGYRSLHSTHLLELEQVLPHADENEYFLEDISPKDMLDASVEYRSKSSSGDYSLESIPDGPLVIDDPSKMDDVNYEELMSDAEYGMYPEINSKKQIPFELQIRTKQMDIEAESGASSHAHYKSGLKTTDLT